ncbi:hypothetical protein D9V41_09335 [Aeromicrobium phragmitis]|uniref:C4-dicarboxylate ABC transporter substrate-binding protein n=1 Tax=Aeromicrobium phragmitis TaxID=2478914 RepID=A0A3L8PNU1_9ACTN|nr:TRAP transporter substrate-binding protein DctP [Aeromicrobium phragmitis]RLV55662.1 hypothetical protein D9V41_09335 [Aeromicrobium phragmitis]
MKKFSFGVAAATLLTGTLAACGSGSSSEDATLKLTFGSSVPSANLVAVKAIEDELIPQLIDRVAAETDYEIEITEQFGTLVGVGEELTGIESGLVDFGTTVFPYEPTALGAMNYPYFVPFSTPDAEVALGAFRSVYEGNADLRALFEDHNQEPLAFFALGDYGLVTTEAWAEPSDLRGRSIVGAGSNLEWLSGLGVSEVSLPGAEWYTSFQTGLVDGAITDPGGIQTLSLNEVAGHFATLKFGSLPIGSVNINADVWDSLPEEVQATVREVCLEWEKEAAQRVNSVGQTALSELGNEGVEVAEPSESGRRAWAEQLKGLPSASAVSLADQGMSGAEIIQAYIDAQVAGGHNFPLEYAVAE